MNLFKNSKNEGWNVKSLTVNVFLLKKKKILIQVNKIIKAFVDKKDGGTLTISGRYRKSNGKTFLGLNIIWYNSWEVFDNIRFVLFSIS